MCGRSAWYRWRTKDEPFEVMLNRSDIEGCGRIGRMSLLMRNPCRARRLHSIVLRTKSGAARMLALRNPSPPLLVLRCAMRIE